MGFKQAKWLIFLVLIASTISVFGAQPISKKKVKYKYLLYKPQNYDSVTQQFPLVIYLHGSSRRGSDINRIKTYGLPYHVSKGEQYDFLIASPQCPAGKSWVSADWFGPLYEELKANFRIDTNRIYVMGMSLGGYGTWHVALDYPNTFAALVPICGGCLDSTNICNISHIPTWAFHGKKDKAVAFSETEKLVKRLQQCGDSIKFTALPNKGHNLAYLFNDPEVLAWMLAQTKQRYLNPENQPELQSLKPLEPDLFGR